MIYLFNLGFSDASSWFKLGILSMNTTEVTQCPPHQCIIKRNKSLSVSTIMLTWTTWLRLFPPCFSTVTIFFLFTINGKIMRLCKHTVIKTQPLALAYPFYKFRCEHFNKRWDPEERTEQRPLHLFNESQTIIQKSQKDSSVLKKKSRELHTSL